MSQPVRSTREQQQQPEQQKDKKKDKKKKKDEPAPGSEDSPDAAAGARRAIKRTLSDFQDGFEGHSPRRVTEFLDDRFEDLPRFEDAVTQFLERSSDVAAEPVSGAPLVAVDALATSRVNIEP